MGCLSIRNLTLALSIVLIVISGGITGFMSITTGNKAVDDTRSVYSRGLDDTRQAGQRGLDACFAAGLNNSRILAEQLMGKVVDDMKSQVKAYLEVPEAAVRQISYWMQQLTPCYGPGSRIQDCEIKHDSWVDNVFKPYVFTVFRDMVPRGVSEVMIIMHPDFNMSVLNYVHSPITMTAENRQKAGVDDDVRSLLVAWYPRSLCKTTMTYDECMAVGTPANPLPVWMPQEEWDYANAGCLWCEPEANPAALPNVPFATNPNHYDVGYCSPNNRCEGGFKKTPANYRSRNYLQLRTVDNRGVDRVGPCKNMVELARRGNQDASSCTVPGFLVTSDFFLLEALTNTENGDNKRLLWGPMNAKGPYSILSAYRAWTHPDYPDWGDAYGRAQSVVVASIDASQISGFMQELIRPLKKENPGTVLYGVQQHPHFIREAPVNYVCKDDRGKLTQLAGISCSILIALFGCDLQINDIDANIARFIHIGDVCPVSCDWCPPDDFEGQGVLLGSTAGRAYSALPLEESGFGENGIEDRYPIYVQDSPDPIVRSHGRHVLAKNNSLGRGYNALSSEGIHMWTYEPSKAGGTIRLSGNQGTENVTAGDGEDRLYWTKVVPLIYQEKALRLHFVLLVERDEAMKLIDEATETTRAQALRDSARVEAKITQESDQVDSDKEENFNIMIAVVIVACFLLMIVAVVFVLNIIRPLLELEYEMSEVASMHLERIDTKRTPHPLEEVGNMQQSFFIMINNLIEYRNYMPASVLQDDEDEEEDEVAQESESQSATGSGLPVSNKDSGLKGRRSSVGSTVRSSNQSKATKGTNLLRDQGVQQQAKFGEGLKRKMVSLLVMNLRSWHHKMEGDSQAGAEAHTAILAAVLEVLNPASKGVPETFSGDRMSVSWNGVKACATHRAKSVEIGAAIQSRLQMASGQEPVKAFLMQKGDALEVSIAVVTGDAKAGNAGCPGMKKFAFFSNIVTWLYALERVSKVLGSLFVTDQFIFTETKSNFLYRTIEQVSFPKRSTKLLTVHEMRGKKEAGEDEWMYQLEEGEKSDPNATWNKFVDAVIAGNLTTAEELLPAVRSDDSQPSSLIDRFSSGLQKPFEPLTIEYH